MDLFCYCYNVIFVLFYTIALSSCFTAYGVTKQKTFRWFGILILAYIFEAVFVAVSSAVSAQPAVLPVYFLVLALFTGIEIYVIGQIIFFLFEREERRGLLILSLAATACSAVGVIIPGDVGWFLDVTTFSLAVFVLCGVYGWLLLKSRGTPYYVPAAKYRGLMATMGIFSMLSILENIIYLVGGHVVIDAIFPTYKNYINFFTDTFSMVLSIWLVIFTRKEQDTYMAQKMEETLQQRMAEFQALEQEKQKKISNEQIEKFGKYYNLTERETEILRLILAGKSNQEISQQLYITVGTVKAHIHSIFSKLEVSRRGQLMNRFVNHGMQ